MNLAMVRTGAAPGCLSFDVLHSISFAARFLLLGFTAQAAETSLLERAVENWLGERDHWAVTQRAVEWDDNKPHERLERYDPSKPGDGRWTLLALDGKAPTAEQQAAWAKKKFRK